MQNIPLTETSWMEVYEDFLNPVESQMLLSHLIDTLDWKQESIFLYGRNVKQPRLTAWLGKGASAASHYSDEIAATPWNEITEKLRENISKRAGLDFNSALVNRYRSGSDSMGFHADDEKVLGKNPVIASLSLGETRCFTVKEKKSSKTTIKLPLVNGSLLLMKGAMQHEFKHGISKTRRQRETRVNITFRRMKIGE
ncbi:alpha-ketoglutarate-dependent dioxygenase AlkB [Oligoflexaceae bacterium]|nr:alpha-ketoglutarate-dependent dioxygenase AlkB [Oligoflexaceae bacterium]